MSRIRNVHAYVIWFCKNSFSITWEYDVKDHMTYTPHPIPPPPPVRFVTYDELCTF